MNELKRAGGAGNHCHLPARFPAVGDSAPHTGQTGVRSAVEYLSPFTLT